MDRRFKLAKAESMSSLSTYLSGGMEAALDGGAIWREELTPFLQKELGLTVYDPVVLGQRLRARRYQNHADLSFSLWKTQNLGSFIDYMKQCVISDVDIITRRIDFMICYWDEYSGAGTISQITIAREHDIPVYLVTKTSPQDLSGWILGCEPILFTSFEQLKQHLKNKVF